MAEKNSEEVNEELLKWAQQLLERRNAQETDPKEAPRKLFHDLQRLFLGFEDAFVKGDYVPGPFLEQVMKELLATVEHMKEADQALRKNSGWTDEEWEKAYGDRGEYDKQTQRFLGDIDSMLERIDEGEARIKRELAQAARGQDEISAAPRKASPQSGGPGKVRKKKRKGLKKKFKKLGGDGYLKT